MIQVCCGFENRALPIRNQKRTEVFEMVDAHLQVKIRLPPEIKEWASARAARNFRSLTSEIAHTLKLAMERDGIEAA
jgi:hypothetical protein